jgi:hypothetical protein
LAQPLAENADFAAATSAGFICACIMVVDINNINPAAILSDVFTCASLFIRWVR